MDAYLCFIRGSEIDLLAYFLLASICFSLVLVVIHNVVESMVPPTAKHARIFILGDATHDAHSVPKESVLLFPVLIVLLNELLDPPYRKDESNPHQRRRQKFQSNTGSYVLALHSGRYTILWTAPLSIFTYSDRRRLKDISQSAFEIIANFEQRYVGEKPES